MQLQYIANIRFPTEKAHGVQIVKTCEALSRAGVRVTLLVSNRHSSIQEDAFSYYAIQKNFTVVRLPVIDLVFLGRFGFWLETLSFSFSACWYAVTHRADCWYSRDELPLYFLSFFRKDIVWESHGGRLNFLINRLLRVSKKIVVISHGLKEFYAAYSPLDIVVAPDGIDLDSFRYPETKEVSRVRLGIPSDKKIVLYVGRVDGWKGVGTLLEASKFLPVDTLVVIIGGEESQVQSLKEQYPSVLFLGFRPYRDLASNQSSADVLVLPNTGKDEVSARFTSPLKLFSYMAAARPMVVSDLPSIREVVTGESVVFFVPDDARSLADAIIAVSTDPALGARIATRARKDIEKYTWDARAREVLKSVV